MTAMLSIFAVNMIIYKNYYKINLCVKDEWRHKNTFHQIVPNDIHFLVLYHQLCYFIMFIIIYVDICIIIGGHIVLKLIRPFCFISAFA